MSTDTTTENAENAPDEEAAAEAQEAVGQLLRDTRKQQGLDLADVARVLRISQRYLDALEAGRTQDLPGPTYAIGFVRSYAEYLSLDGEEIVRRYKAQADGVGAPADLVFPKPIPDSGVPGAAVLGLGVIIAAVVYGIWYWDSTKSEVAVDRVQPVPERLAEAMADESPDEDGSAGSEGSVAPLPEDATTPAPDVAADMAEDTMASAEASPEAEPEPAAVMGETANEAEQAVTGTAEDDAQDVVQDATQDASQDVPQDMSQDMTQDAMAETVQDSATNAQDTIETASIQVDAAAEETPAPEGTTPEAGDETADTAPTATENATEPAETASTEADAAESAPTAEPASPADGPSRITVRAKSNSWIQIRDEALDRLLFTRLLRAGDEYEVPDRDGLELMTGNAGALEIIVDGEAIAPLGAVGEVRRNVELDPDKLLAGTAAGQ